MKILSEDVKKIINVIGGLSIAMVVGRGRCRVRPVILYNRAFLFERRAVMRIITVSREFGSGGRELGKRLAEALAVPCYDHEIVEMIAEKSGLDKNYIEHISEKDIRAFYPSTVAHRFMSPHPAIHQPLQVAVAQREIIEQLAAKSDCVIVGRGADIILREFAPLNIFVYADNESKLARCRARSAEGEVLTDKQILKNMKQIDKERMGYHQLFMETEWGCKESYDLCINTSGREIRTLIPAIADYAVCWFGK